MRNAPLPYKIAPMPLAPINRSPWLPILRPKAGASVEATVLSIEPYPCGTHYFPAGTLRENPTTLPHTSPTCDCFGCYWKRPTRAYAYLVGFVLPISRQHLIELTAGALSQLERDYALVRPSWRGLTIRLTRQGKHQCGPVRAYFLKARESEDALPLAFDTEEALRRLWGNVPLRPPQ